MVKLTEEMIIARTRVSDMSNVKKLNCWGAELTDVSVLRKLTNVEVLSLSVNCISTLADIQNCRNLKELYIRKNKIPDLNELCWLRDLSMLKSLWLEENPCVQDHGELYRVTVIRNLPQLQKLDNVEVQPDEMADAMRRGLELIHPLDSQPVAPQSSSGQYQSMGYASAQNAQLEDLSNGSSSSATRRASRTSYYDNSQPTSAAPEYYTEEKTPPTRRQSVQEQLQTPSRRVSNQVFEQASTSTNQGSGYESSKMSYSSRRNSAQPTTYITTDDGNGYVPEYHTGRRYSSQEGPRRSSPRMSQSSLEDSTRRMSMQHDQGPNYDDERNANSGYNHPGRAYEQYHEQSPGYGYQGGHYETRAYETLPEHETCSGSQNGGSPSPNEDATNHADPNTPNPSRGQQRTLHASRSASSTEGLVMATHKPMKRSSSAAPTANSMSQEKAQGKLEHCSESGRATVAQHYEQAYDQVSHQIESAQKHIASRKSFSPDRNTELPRRPRNRNSNILSAVLCLIKELDGPSLEVVEMAVRCRMEELED